MAIRNHFGILCRFCHKKRINTPQLSVNTDIIPFVSRRAPAFSTKIPPLLSSLLFLSVFFYD